MMDTENLPGLTRPNISEEVYRTLRERFLSQQFKPGQRLHLAEMEKQMEISRTPLKDALNRLALEGLVKIKPRSGTFVAPLDPREIAESFDVRRVLELYALELAVPSLTAAQLREIHSLAQEMGEALTWMDEAQKYRRYVELDHKMHELLVAYAGNRRLKAAWEQVNVHGQMARVHYQSEEALLKLSQQEHEDILHALEARDVVAAQRALDYHIKRAKDALLAEIAKLDAAAMETSAEEE